MIFTIAINLPVTLILVKVWIWTFTVQINYCIVLQVASILKGCENNGEQTNVQILSC